MCAGGPADLASLDGRNSQGFFPQRIEGRSLSREEAVLRIVNEMCMSTNFQRTLLSKELF